MIKIFEFFFGYLLTKDKGWLLGKPALIRKNPKQ
jgi:hypothetical protein